MKGVWEVCECIEPRSTFQNYTTVISSMEIYANNCIVLINGMMKSDADGGQGTKDYLEWPKLVVVGKTS